MCVCDADHSSLFLQPGVHSELVQREKERVGLYRQKTKAALVIQLAWRRFIRRKRQQQALLAQQRALQVSLRDAPQWGARPEPCMSSVALGLSPALPLILVLVCCAAARQ